MIHSSITRGLKKVVLAVGNRLIHTDTYDEALAKFSTGAHQLIQQAGAAALSAAPAVGGAAAAAPAMAAQGRWSEAGKELEAIEAQAR